MLKASEVEWNEPERVNCLLVLPVHSPNHYEVYSSGWIIQELPRYLWMWALTAKCAWLASDWLLYRASIRRCRRFAWYATTECNQM
jgi:hypothetical protein